MAGESDIRFDEIELIRSVCHESFYDFVVEFWDVVIPDDPVWNWHIEYLCSEIQIAVERVFRREPKLYDLVINVPPGSTKSTIVSRMLLPWCWTRKPWIRMINSSYEWTLAAGFSRHARDIITCPKYQSAFGPMILREDQNTKDHFINDKKGERIATGTRGALGRHGDILGIDDPIDPKGVKSEALINAANTFIFETLFNRKTNSAVSLVILVQQRLHQNDATGQMLERMKGNVKHICLPAEVEDGPKPARLRRKYRDGLLDPIRLSRKILAQKMDALKEYGYAAQYRQSPVPPGGGMFKVDRMIADTSPIPPLSWLEITRYWDKAGTDGGGDYTVGAKMGKDVNGRYWVLDIIRDQWDSAERESIIKSTAEADGRKVVVGVEQEPGSGGKESAQNTVNNLAGWKCYIDKVVMNKPDKADPFSTQVNAGNVRYEAKREWIPKLIDEMRFFPFSTNDDQVDALSGGFNYLTRPKKLVGALF